MQFLTRAAVLNDATSPIEKQSGDFWAMEKLAVM
jgi:hypothetical protein